MNENLWIDETYKEAWEHNPLYGSGKLFKTLLSIPLIITLFSGPADAQTIKRGVVPRGPVTAMQQPMRQSIGQQPRLSPRMPARPVMQYPTRVAQRQLASPNQPITRISRNSLPQPVRGAPPRTSVSRNSLPQPGRVAVPRISTQRPAISGYRPLGPYEYPSHVLAHQLFCWRGWYGVVNNGLFYWLWDEYQFRRMQMRGMFCNYSLFAWNGPCANIDDEYRAQLRGRIEEYEMPRQGEPQTIEKEVPVEVIKEVPAKYSDYYPGYVDHDILPGQWNSQTISYFNWEFNIRGNLLHAYSPGRIIVDGKAYDFDVVVRREKDGVALYALEFKGNGSPGEDKKIELIESGRVHGYVLSPKSRRGPELKDELKPYLEKMLRTNL